VLDVTVMVWLVAISVGLPLANPSPKLSRLHALRSTPQSGACSWRGIVPQALARRGGRETCSEKAPALILIGYKTKRRLSRDKVSTCLAQGNGNWFIRAPRN
jgi:hypothetical protein